MTTITEAAVTKHVQNYLRDYEDRLGPREPALFERVFTPPLARYTKRLRAIRFTDMDRVLDACCGFGQWTLCLAELNRRVDACDISPVRAEIVNTLAHDLGIDSIKAVQSRLETLPYEDNTFDGAFCYVSLTCTPWKESLQELHRVLKPGGRAYFTANALGYFVRQWVEEPHKTAQRSPRFFTALSLKNTLEYEETGKGPELGQVVVEKDEMRTCLDEIGFTITAMEDEGCIDLTNGEHPPTSFFPGEYNGLTCCYEVIASK
ncbi:MULTISPECIES: class I SAM-dependent methyltransferase [unclassified Pseudodesulfovibrio]|uniref:class I SAM-dependent methyltransferase n=1 Tax=unclassified Pseudodesulfovibrio TaxID=2661612 RepID=UPI0013E2C29D|nr:MULTISPECIES: class I SAM-dependent methyltransferase [unclassified Pseudodesulfovibrio]MCJ2165644.1 class I SAM-dependent methyltransferase [Pseudodesulfovibrio sp. S3-i]